MSNQFLIKLTLFGLSILLPYKALALTPINTCADLKNINNNLNEDYFVTTDIDCKDYSLSSIGSYFSGKSFKGSLDGTGHKISNIVSPYGTYYGLFSYTQNATIKNLIIENIKTNHRYQSVAGCLIATAEQTTIDNVSCSGSIYNIAEPGSSTPPPATVVSGMGGLVGIMSKNSIIINSSAVVSVELNAQQIPSGKYPKSVPIGGLVGVLNDTSSIINSNASGFVAGTSSLGGLVGLITEGSQTIKNSYATGKVLAFSKDGSASNMGGLVGTILYSYNKNQTHPILIENSYAINNVGSLLAQNVGGLVGVIIDYSSCKYLDMGPQIINSFAKSNLEGNYGLGGLIGSAKILSLTNSYSASHLSPGPYGPYDQRTAGNGLIGDSKQSCVQVISTYWDKDKAALKTIYYPAYKELGRTTAEMYQKNNYANWDFDMTWAINESQSYPCLRSLTCSNSNKKVQ